MDNFKRSIAITLLLTLSGPCMDVDLSAQTSKKPSEETIKEIKALLYQKPDSAEVLCRELIENIENVETEHSHLLSAQRLLGILLDIKGEYSESLDMYDQVIAGVETEDDSIHWANANLGKGIIYHRLKEFDEAILLYNKALGVYSQNDDANRASSVLNNIAAIYNDIGLHEDALKIYQLELIKARERKDSSRIGSILTNLSNTYRQLEIMDSAINYNHLATSFGQQRGDYYGLGSSYFTKGTLFKDLGILDSSLYYYEKSLKPTKGIFLRANLAHITGAIGEVYMMKKDYDLAITYLDSSLSVAERQNLNDDLIPRAYQLKGEVMDKTDQPYAAATAWKNAFQALDSSAKKTLDARLVHFAQKTKSAYYKKLMDERASENEVLKIKNEQTSNYLIWLTILSVTLAGMLIAIYLAWKNKLKYEKTHLRLNAELDSKLRNSQRVLAVLAHDFRSPLKSMNAMLDLYELDDLTIEERKDFVAKARRHIETTLKGMDQMLLWTTKNTKTQNAEKVPLDGLIEEVYEFYKNEFEQHNFHLHYDQLEGCNMYFDARNLEAIIRNIFSNCLKYCNDGTSIDVNYSRNDKEETLSVHDNGPGMKSDVLTNIRSNNFDSLRTSLADKPNSTGIGMELIHDLANNNGARITIDSTEGSGTTISIIRPLH